MGWQVLDWFDRNRPPSLSIEDFNADTGVNYARLARCNPKVMSIGPVDRVIHYLNPWSSPLSSGEFVVIPRHRQGAIEMARTMLLGGIPEEMEMNALAIQEPDAIFVRDLLLELRGLMETEDLDIAQQFRDDIDDFVYETSNRRLGAVLASMNIPSPAFAVAV
jgi:hypothetical protein